MYETISSIGLVEIMIKAMQDFANYENQAKKSAKPKLANEDQVMQQNIST